MATVPIAITLCSTQEPSAVNLRRRPTLALRDNTHYVNADV